MTQNVTHVRAVDPELADLLTSEYDRQRDSIRLIASENYASAAVMEATGSVLTNKYSEGYPTRRYYEGQEFIDPIELLAIERAKALFGADHANVQPYSGSPANLAAYYAMCEVGDKVVGMGLAHGGHLTHGHKVSFSGRFYEAHQYPVDPKTERIDMAEVRRVVLEHRPKMVIAGASAYPRVVDFAAFAEIAAEVGARFVADIAHISGLVAAGLHPSPVPVADVVTTTTHKTLRGPRGGMILCKAEHAAAIDKAVFPGLQGGPHNHTTAAIAVALKEAAAPSFKAYMQQVVANAHALAEALVSKGLRLVTGGTDNHLLLVDLGPRNVSGKPVAKALNSAGIVCNANAIPYDPRKPWDPSGIRIGTAAVTTRGMTEADMVHIASWIDTVLSNLDDADTIARVRQEVRAFCAGFPTPS